MHQNSKCRLMWEKYYNSNWKQQTCSKWVQDKAIGKVESWKKWPYNQMVYAQIRIRPRKGDTIKFFEILRYKQITSSWTEAQT